MDTPAPRSPPDRRHLLGDRRPRPGRTSSASWTPPRASRASCAGTSRRCPPCAGAPWIDRLLRGRRARQLVVPVGRRSGCPADTISLKAARLQRGQGRVAEGHDPHASRAYDPDVDRDPPRPASASPAMITRHPAQAHLVTAGDGKHQHPTQCLLDLYTMPTAPGPDLGPPVAIVGRRPALRGSPGRTSPALVADGCPRDAGRPAVPDPARASMRWASRSATTSPISTRRTSCYVLRMQRERMSRAPTRVPSLRGTAPRWGVTSDRVRPRPAGHAPGPDEPRRGDRVGTVADAASSVSSTAVAGRPGLPIARALRPCRAPPPARPARALRVVGQRGGGPTGGGVMIAARTGCRPPRPTLADRRRPPGSTRQRPGRSARRARARGRSPRIGPTASMPPASGGVDARGLPLLPRPGRSACPSGHAAAMRTGRTFASGTQAAAAGASSPSWRCPTPTPSSTRRRCSSRF